jgi:hypothetical protein
MSSFKQKQLALAGRERSNAEFAASATTDEQEALL